MTITLAKRTTGGTTGGPPRGAAEQLATLSSFGVRQAVRRVLPYCLPRGWLVIDGRRYRPPVPAAPATSDPSEAAAGAATPVMLTFDDGPHPEHTPRLLDALAAAGFRATFFVVGERARRHPDLVRRIHAAGHEVANHTDTHAEPRSIGWRAFRQELLRTSALLEDLLGEPVRLMRPPKGALTPAKLLAAWSLGLSVVLWNRDPKDYRITDIADIERWLAGYRPHSGDIVLMHDTHPWAAHAVEHWRQATALTSVPVGEWIGRRRPPRGERHSGTPHAAATPPSALPSREQSPSTN